MSETVNKENIKTIFKCRYFKASRDAKRAIYWCEYDKTNNLFTELYHLGFIQKYVWEIKYSWQPINGIINNPSVNPVVIYEQTDDFNEVIEDIAKFKIENGIF